MSRRSLLLKKIYGRTATLASVIMTVMIASSFGGFDTPLYAQEGRVSILHSNDMHARFLESGGQGGYARFARKVSELRQQNDTNNIPTLLVDAGDFTMGTAFQLLYGEAEFTFMNTVGYDVITLGNHEFDWKPEGTAVILSFAQGLPIVASNMIFDSSSSADDELESLYQSGVIQPYYVKTLDDGTQVGFFGLMGKDADEVAPFAYPVTFADQAESAQSMVDTLTGEGVDLIVCLSHSGLEEDPELAAAVPGIDIIISGHTHEITESPVIVGDTVIVQAGDYARHIGKLDLDVSETGISVVDYEVFPLDQTTNEDPEIADLVQGFIDRIDSEILAPMGLAFYDVIAESAYEMPWEEGVEMALGNLVADANRWMVDAYEYDPVDPDSKVDFAMASNGVIRDEILPGPIAFYEAYNILPLGFGLDGDIGYPMVTIHVTGEELRKAMEVLTTVYGLKGASFWLNISGMRLEYARMGIPFFLVRNIYVGDEINGYDPTPLDTSASNPELYKIALNYYEAQFISVVGDFTAGILTIDPKDSQGVSYSDEVAHPNGLDEARVDIDPATPGIQELRQWKGFLDYLSSFEDVDENGLPDVPERYSGPTGRIEEVSCFIATAAYGSYMDPHVEVLRSFRDRVLVKSAWGRQFIDFYYEHGPKAAAWIEDHPGLRPLVRGLLLPLVGMAKAVLSFV